MKRYLDVKNNRLVYIGYKADREMWEKRWEKEDIEKLFMQDNLTSMDKVLIDITRKYLPKDSRILEGGCGLGNYVYMLERNGYEVIGVDYAEKTIEMMRSIMPFLDLRCGNLENLQFDSNYFSGCWSIGVIEHFYDGYNNIVREMFRVLQPGGYIFLAVPAFSKLRKLKAELGFFPIFREEDVGIGEFYQFAMSPDEIKKVFYENGFEFLEQKGWNVYKGISDEITGSRLVMSLLTRFIGGIIERALRNYCNHMYIFVFKKKSCRILNN